MSALEQKEEDEELLRRLTQVYGEALEIARDYFRNDRRVKIFLGADSDTGKIPLEITQEKNFSKKYLLLDRAFNRAADTEPPSKEELRQEGAIYAGWNDVVDAILEFSVPLRQGFIPSRLQ